MIQKIKNSLTPKEFKIIFFRFSGVYFASIKNRGIVEIPVNKLKLMELEARFICGVK